MDFETIQDKENQVPNLAGSFSRDPLGCPVKLRSKNGDNCSLKADKKSQSCFSRLLKESTSEILSENDQTLAMKIIMSEAKGITTRWAMEEEGELLVELERLLINKDAISKTRFLLGGKVIGHA